MEKIKDRLNFTKESLINEDLPVALRGYSVDRVDQVLDRVAEDYGTYEALLAELRDKNGELTRTLIEKEAVINNLKAVNAQLSENVDMSAQLNINHTLNKLVRDVGTLSEMVKDKKKEL